MELLRETVIIALVISMPLKVDPTRVVESKPLLCASLIVGFNRKLAAFIPHMIIRTGEGSESRFFYCSMCLVWNEAECAYDENVRPTYVTAHANV